MRAMRDELKRTFSRAAARAADREAIEEWGIPGAVLMENAGRAVAAAALRLSDGPGPVLMLVGTGGNGGDGWVAARHLVHAGCEVQVAELAVPRADSDAALYRRVARRMGIAVVDDPKPHMARQQVIVDAMYGTGLTRPIDGFALEWTRAVNASSVPVLAVDLPSGLDADSGMPLGLAVRAAMTVTFLGPKKGFAAPGAEEWTGPWIADDIGMPADIRRRHGVWPQ